LTVRSYAQGWGGSALCGCYVCSTPEEEIGRQLFDGSFVPDSYIAYSASRERARHVEAERRGG
jgi:hypothetical protein